MKFSLKVTFRDGSILEKDDFYAQNMVAALQTVASTTTTYYTNIVDVTVTQISE